MRCSISRASPKRPSKLALTFSLIVLLAGCASGRDQETESGRLAPAALPNYGLGDSYHFTDGSSDTVIAVDDNLVHWRGEGGTFDTSHDVLLPRVAWNTGNAQGERQIGAGPVLLFPLETGKSVKFTASRTVRSANGATDATVQEHWNCSVVGTERVSTRVGDFDTWRVDCAMQEEPPVTGHGLVQRSFYYAPAIGYYVRVEERVDDGDVKVADLSGYTTADPALAISALRQRSAALQRAMETELSGSRAAWTDPATGSAGDVVLMDTKHSDRYGWCRDFAEHIQWAGRLYVLNGTGCRDPGKVWNIV